MNSRNILFSIFSVLIVINVGDAFAITENFLVLPDDQKTLNLILNENQKIFFQIFIKGGIDDDIRLKIVDNDTNFVYFNSIIRQEKQDMEYDSAIFPAYKSEITNSNSDTKHLTFVFDNSLSTSNSKKIDFTYTIFAENGTNFEQTTLWSWISAFVTIVIVIISVIIVIVMVIKKLKQKSTS